MKVTAVDLLADVEHLRAFTDVLACDRDCSPRAILEAISSVLERRQRQQADDMSEVLRLGRVRQIARVSLIGSPANGRPRDELCGVGRAGVRAQRRSAPPL